MHSDQLAAAYPIITRIDKHTCNSEMLVWQLKVLADQNEIKKISKIQAGNGQYINLCSNVIIRTAKGERGYENFKLHSKIYHSVTLLS